MQFSTIRHLICASLCAAVLPASASAEGSEWFGSVSSDGHSYQVTCNESGFILTSTYPVSRFIENGVLSTVREGIETIYLGKSCDAFTEAYGAGTWGFANGGYAVSFEDYRVGFPRQAPYCEGDDAAPRTFDFNCPL